MKRAFTLIELLVVVAIVAILAGLLFPVIVKSRQSARRTDCILHMRQVSVAIDMYRYDNDDRWPMGKNYTETERGLKPYHPAPVRFPTNSPRDYFWIITWTELRYVEETDDRGGSTSVATLHILGRGLVDPCHLRTPTDMAIGFQWDTQHGWEKLGRHSMRDACSG